MLEVLYKKACGYTIKERVKEYSYDEEGNQRLVKEKVHSKHIPPDMSAIKEYIASNEKLLFEMTEEQLRKEKYRLLKKLQQIEYNGGIDERKRNGTISKRNKNRF